MGSMYANMVTFTINIPPMLAYIPAPWILWVLNCGTASGHFQVPITVITGFIWDLMRRRPASALKSWRIQHQSMFEVRNAVGNWGKNMQKCKLPFFLHHSEHIPSGYD